VRRSRQRSQSVVEFGIIAILFTLIMFAIVDFGLLLNDWLSVSAGARQLGRDAAVGLFTCAPADCAAIVVTPAVTPDFTNEAQKLNIPGIAADPPLTGYCCGAGSALIVDVTYYNQCTPGVGACSEVTNMGTLDSRYSSHGNHGTCTSWQANILCDHPSPPRKAGNCPGAPGPVCPGDSVQVKLTAYAQVLTPLVRPFFANANNCQANAAHCFVPLSTTLTMRFEGDTL
jgi:TadE-like protein